MNNMQEIERKFLVKSIAYRDQAHKSYVIKQGFLNSDPERTVRVRTNQDKAYLTIQGLSSENGLSRFEWETEISADEGASLLQLCQGDLIEKERFEVMVGSHVFEVDEFRGKNKGLVIAEIELEHSDECFDKPEWLGKEVTGQIEYYNANLSIKPYGLWKD